MNIAIIRQGTGRYLFSVPENIEIKEGDNVKCDTKRGITDGVAWADSLKTDENTAQLIAKLTGAKFPLKSVVGKTITSVELFAQPAQEEPAQPKAEPIKLYCTADGTGKRSLRKGDVCKFVDNHFVFPDGYVYPYEHEDIDGFCEQNYGYAQAGFIPLVSRPAKVGEWVYVTDDSGHYYEKNKIYQVKHTGRNVGSVYFGIDGSGNVQANQYLVLDGYDGRYEKPKEPIFVTTSILRKLGACSGGMAEFAEKFPSGKGEFEEVCEKACGSSVSWLRANKECVKAAQGELEYLNTRVVCVDNGGFPCFWTVGKIYSVIDGKIKYNSGDVAGERIGSFADFEKHFSAKFIEFKGE